MCTTSTTFGGGGKPLQVKQTEAIRNCLPVEHATFIVAKNNLMKEAIKDNDNFKDLGSHITGSNAWIIASEEGVAETIKAYLKYKKDSRLDREFFAGAMDGQVRLQY